MRLLILIMMLSGCATSTRIDTRLTGLDYNDLAGKYMGQVTNVVVEEHDGMQWLMIDYFSYDGNILDHSFSDAGVDGYVRMINRYLEWERIASADRDQIDREIGQTADDSGIRTRFTMYSGNAGHHLMTVEHCAMICSGNRLYFDKVGAVELRTLLIKLQSGNLGEVDYSKYRRETYN